MKTRPVATPSTAGALAKAGGTPWSVVGWWNLETSIGALLAAQLSLLLTSLTRFIDTQFKSAQAPAP